MSVSVYETTLSTVLGTTFGGQASALTGTVYDKTGTALTLYDASGNSLSTTVFTSTEIGTNTGNYQATVYLPYTQRGIVVYTWTGTPAIPTLGTDVVAPSPVLDAGGQVAANNVTVVVSGGGAFSSTSASSGPTLSALPPPFNLEYPRGQQVSLVFYLRIPITGRTLTWQVKTNKTDADGAAILKHDNAGIGGISLNVAPVTVGGITYAPNQVATLTIGAGECTNTAVFPENRRVWMGWHLTGPPEMSSAGWMVVQTFA